MKRIIAGLILTTALAAQAQTTPLSVGLHQAEDNGDIAYTGTGWATVIDGDYSYMQSSDIGDLMTFEFNGSAIILFRDLITSPVTLTNTAGLNTPINIGDVGSIEYRQAQQFSPISTGAISQFTFELDTNNNAPSGGISWQIRADNSNAPTGSLLASGGPIAVTASATNTVTISNGPVLDQTLNYWLVLFTQNQNTNQYYRWKTNNPESYPDHYVSYSTNGGTSWSIGGNPTAFSITTLGASEVEMCLNSACTTVGNYSSPNRERVPIGYIATGTPPHTFTIENLTDAAFRIDSLMIVVSDGADTTQLVQAQTTNPAAQFLALDSGRVVAIDYSVSAGDIAQIIFLAFLSALTLFNIVLKRVSHE